MAEVKVVNGYQIKKMQDGGWWLIGHDGEQVAGPFPSESSAVEVASVFEDLAPRSRPGKKS
ncbi:hypothetical protein ACIPO9_26280 [Pseudomonas sp. NPDC090203]|jgi:hypothetical protein|uniref:hypothetical protein n=1 Tax=Pseudomonas TaxID=286 RepID=UPI0023646F96|nr:hypothetical protein [Pseudomonas putida]MDD1964448.1 hypothetical protein [Pseudomonas putida]